MKRKKLYKNWICKCKNCNKDIDAYEYNGFINYAYKIQRKVSSEGQHTILDKYHIFCSWHCLREFEKANEIGD